MKKFFCGGLTLLLCLLACTNDIGTLDFKRTEQKEFSVFVPGTGTFEFTQTFNTTPSITDITTDLKVVDAENVMEPVSYELLVFKSNTISFDSLDFEVRGMIVKNDSVSRINSEGRALISRDNLLLSVFDTGQNSLSGHYEGFAMLQNQDTTQAPEIFNVFGNIDNRNQLTLLSVQSNASITRLKGTYTGQEGDFFGEARSRTAVLGAVFTDTMVTDTSGDTTTDEKGSDEDSTDDTADESDEDQMDSEENNTSDLMLSLIAKIDNVERKLELHLNKID